MSRNPIVIRKTQPKHGNQHSSEMPTCCRGDGARNGRRHGVEQKLTRRQAMMDFSPETRPRKTDSNTSMMHPIRSPCLITDRAVANDHNILARAPTQSDIMHH